MGTWQRGIILLCQKEGIVLNSSGMRREVPFCPIMTAFHTVEGSHT